MLQNIDLIHRYLSLSITDKFHLNIDLEGEYTFTQNIVSKKTIIAATFTDKIRSYPELKLFVSALIAEINGVKSTAEYIREKIRHIEELSHQHIRKIG